MVGETAPVPQRRSILFPLLAALLGIGATLGLAEIVLRLADFNPARVNPGFLQFGYRTGIPTHDEDGLEKEGHPVRVLLFHPDPEVFWTTLPGTGFTNRRGFRGRREYAEAKPPDTLRILFLGDSCTFIGDPIYPDLVQDDLARRFPGKNVECINASVPGYTSFQGRMLLPRLRRWDPDLVCIYFGWNDHWPGQGGLTDEMQYSLARGSRVVDLVEAFWIRGQQARTPRVPLPEFERNLVAIRDTVESWGARPVFITAPTGFRAGEMPGWSYGFFARYYQMDPAAVTAIPGIHEDYADAARKAASGNRALLVDAAAGFRAEGLPAEEFFRKDRIHLRTPGHRWLAGKLSDVIGSAVGP